MKRHLIQLENISKTFHMESGEVIALKPLTIDIGIGESVAIMGPSGSGKSTLMHLLGCLDRPSSGRYWLELEDVSSLEDAPLSEIRSKKIGFVFQSFHLIPHLSVLENVMLPFQYQQITLLEAREKAKQALEHVKMSHRLTHRPSQLSGGEMQRVAVARALAIQPRLILADEPTGNLDTANGKAILNLFLELNKAGVTVVVVTHDLEVGSHFPRILHMKDGALFREERT